MKLFLTGPHGYSSVHNEPSLSLSAYLQSKGWELVNSAEDADAICSIEIPLNRLHFPKISRDALKKGLVVIQEPGVVRPFHDKDHLLAKFAEIILAGRAGVLGGVKWPALYLERFYENSRVPKKEEACLIASNKVSFLPGELYSLRREVIEKRKDVELFGNNWDSPLRQRLKQVLFEAYLCLISWNIPQLRNVLPFIFSKFPNNGAVVDKLDENRNFKVTIVIENSEDYMSEKLLEAISAGSIPVYVGPPVSLFGIPEDLVVQVVADSASICEGIRVALEMDFDSWVNRCAAWISNPSNLDSWTLSGYWEKINRNLVEIASRSISAGE